MRISARVRPGSKEDRVEVASDGVYNVRVKAPPIEGRANEAARRAIARHFGVPGSRVVIKHGSSGRRKLIEIL